MKNTSSNNKRKKYAVGTSITNYIEDPSTVLAQNDINISKTKYEAASDPLIQGMKMLGNTAMQFGGSMLSSAKGVDPNLVSGIKGGANLLTGLSSMSFATGGSVTDGLDEEIIAQLQQMADSQGITLEELIANLQNFSQESFGLGGSVNNKIPVEVEGEEVAETPQGQLLNFQGPSHEQGGIDADLPEGTEVYSKRIAIDGKTMAERKLKRESIVARYTKKVEKGGGAIEKNTLNRIVFATQQEEAKDNQIQQAIHNALTAQNKTLVDNREQHATDPIVGLKPKTIYDASIPDVGYENTSKVSKTPYEEFLDEFNKNIYPEDEMSALRESSKEDVISELDGIDSKKESPNIWKSVKDTLPLTSGDALNMAGNIFQGVAPYLNNLNQRATDTPNENKFKDFGKEGIDKLSQTENFHKQVLDDALQNLERSRQSTTTSARRGAKGVNTMRALDLANEENASNQSRSLYDSYAARMAQTMAQEAGMENQQDQMVMQGEQARDLADRQDKDAFYTANGELLRNLGMTGANAGKQMNQALARENTYKLLGTNQFGYNSDSGEIFGKVQEALNIPLGEKMSVYNIKEAWDKGLLEGKYATLEDAIKDYNNLTTSRPDLLIPTNPTVKSKATTSKKTT